MNRACPPSTPKPLRMRMNSSCRPWRFGHCLLTDSEALRASCHSAQLHELWFILEYWFLLGRTDLKEAGWAPYTNTSLDKIAWHTSPLDSAKLHTFPGNMWELATFFHPCPKDEVGSYIDKFLYK